MTIKKIKYSLLLNQLKLVAGFLIVTLLGLLVYWYYDYFNSNAAYSYDELKSKNTVISEQEIYDFMNFAFFNADSILKDKREFAKINCFTIQHGQDISNFINSLSDTVLTSEDKIYMKTQMVKQPFLWDKDKLINVWCLTPKDLYKIKDDKEYWVNFRKAFGKYGHHHYSKPIFNNDKTLVVIEYSGQGDFLMGSGNMLLFKKEKGKWQLIKNHNLWIS